MKTIEPRLIGRFGNQIFIYAKAKALAEQNGYRLQCEPWVGEKVFTLDHEKKDREADIIVDGYCQDQESLIYSGGDCKRWFRIRQEHLKELDKYPLYGWTTVVAHRRVGDYLDLGYVVVSRESYTDAAIHYCHAIDWICTEEHSFGPQVKWSVDPELNFLADFLIMMKSKVLFRGNSSFSWWASVLGSPITYSPVIDGLEGGKVQHCKFVEGNWPKFANLPNVTDLHLKP